MAEDRQGKRWTREEWEAMLEQERRAEAARPAVVRPGARVTVELVPAGEAGGSERLEITLVPDDRADLERGFLGLGTPLGKRLLNQETGSTLPYPHGDVAWVRILAVVPGDVPETSAAAGRQAALQKAVTRSETEDILRLALTVDVKWGSYDPDGLVPDDPEEPA
jgi:transcription elongation GreA/GreB family factor